MTDGFWRIKQFSPGSPSGFAVTEILLNANTGYSDTSHGLIINHMDDTGSTVRVEYFPWASIVHAEYQPPTASDLTIPDEDW